MHYPKKKLGEVVIPLTERNVNADLPYIGMEDIESGTGRIITEPQIKNVKSSTFHFDDSVVLYGKLRPYLNKVFLPDFEGHTSTEFIPLAPKKDELDRKWLGLWLSSQDTVDKVMTTISGTRMPRADLKQIFKFEITLPTLPEQKKIVARIEQQFAKIDEAIKLREQSLALTEQLLPAEIHEVINLGKQEWSLELLGELCEVLDNRRKPVTRKDRRAGPFPYYGATGVQDYVDDYIFNEPLLLLGEDGARWGANQQSAYPISGKTWVNNHAHVLRPNRKKVLDSWLKYFLNYSDLSEYITGTTVKKLNQEKMKSIETLVPPLAEQQSVVKKLDAIAEKAKTLKKFQEKQLSDLKELKQGILREVFSE